ncbi:hypothetical protein [Methylobacterium fujisawaense]|uniref:hypothetical protein n=1 Tax=Methylobacterium fujisawaense TaxID=107400 RepID=UPI00313EDF0C
MSTESDHTLPGKAGLYFRTEALTASGWHQEHQARSRLERWCFDCGQSACYGFGVSLTDDGVWSCGDASCQAAAEAEIARRGCPSPLAKPSDEPATLDLFGAAA